MKSKIFETLVLPTPPDFDLHIKTDYSFQEIWNLIGPKMFYNKILGYKGNYISDLENNDEKALLLKNNLKRIQDFVISNTFNLMQPKALWQFFRAKSNGDEILIFNGKNDLLTTFTFPRQKKHSLLCLSDYISQTNDSLCFFVCTAGNKVSEFANLWIEEGRYQDAFLLQGLALATAEALAELVHKDIRSQWGLTDPKNITLDEIMKGKYSGCRYSFGYPACPNLEDQEKLWNLLNPKLINVELTEGFMMDPEASVSAIVFHHPEAKYFSV